MTNSTKGVAIQFFRGVDEKSQPVIRLKRNKDKKTGCATYKFIKPTSISYQNYKDVKIMYLIDEEGELSTRKISIYISEDNLNKVESTINWKSDIDFNRFMRFAKRYAELNKQNSKEN